VPRRESSNILLTNEQIRVLPALRADAPNRTTAHTNALGQGLAGQIHSHLKRKQRSTSQTEPRSRRPLAIPLADCEITYNAAAAHVNSQRMPWYIASHLSEICVSGICIGEAVAELFRNQNT